MKFVAFRDHYGRDFELHELGSSPVDQHFSTWSESEAFQVLKRMADDGNIRSLQSCSRLLFRDDGQTAIRDPARVIELLGSYLRVGYFTLYQMLPKPGMSRPTEIATLESVSESVEFQRKDISTLELVPEREQPVALQGRGKKVYWGNNKVDKEMPDETDKKRCPSANYISESTDTAIEKVRDFLDKYVRLDVADPAERKKYWDEDLGKTGGGGFLRYHTRTATIKEGTVLWRYINYEKSNPVGSWWFRHPLEGDPRVFAALPKDSRGTYLVKGRARKDIEVLIGPGAPRCSNKPGGPEQIYMPFAASPNDPSGRKIPENINMILE
jgi:hypothetical protein